jgi:hypothetical protein
LRFDGITPITADPLERIVIVGILKIKTCQVRLLGLRKTYGYGDQIPCFGSGSGKGRHQFPFHRAGFAANVAVLVTVTRIGVGNRSGFTANVTNRITSVIVAMVGNTVLAARNLADAKLSATNTLNVYEILKYKKLVLTKEAVKAIEEVYA